ncbi:uncharacterized protein MELLADRAFT_66568 [Melampsora larici-populina 98AG31]|uniref:CCHC-type domain-containing protein n=1 Tax=Melampsora larici-populina (strain 98AG31 / pathotype 3-4-7) TaxID=747676 RepID=F4RZR6_MELLP|nr:uncharacterized protein MELLADRAFT_66568 [Melampsora larici-populina 98AG31]EGG02142.1 hypothetical protein MELLADRAFT_66568 [Melampsora larici-populina 98AG31]
MNTQSTLRHSARPDFTHVPIQLTTRRDSELYHVPIPITAHPFLALARDQCFNCGWWNHTKPECAHPSEYWCKEGPEQWRRMPNGKFYSMKALLGLPPYHKKPLQQQLDLGVLGPAINLRGPMSLNSDAYRSVINSSSMASTQNTFNFDLTQSSTPKTSSNYRPMSQNTINPSSQQTVSNYLPVSQNTLNPSSQLSDQLSERHPFEIPSSMPSSDFIATPTRAVRGGHSLETDVGVVLRSANYTEVINWSPE